MTSSPKNEFSAERIQRLRRGLTADSKVSNLQLFEAINDLRGDLSALKTSVSGLQKSVSAPPPAVAPAPPTPARLDEVSAINHDEDVRLEIAQMVRMIGKTKREISQIRHPSVTEDGDNVTKATNELDSIILATEDATNTILDASERIEELAQALARNAHDDPDVQVVCAKIGNYTTTILEASNFQDITGQRVTKVVKTLRFIEERIMEMINIWGVDSFIDMPVNVDERTGDDKLMNGPAAMGEEKITQDDIDALFD